MVNLVLVSHSYTLACSVAELAEQMNQGCQIAVAAGLEEPENAIGTDAVRIMTAIEQVYSPDGVVVLMDLGSAILSAETALDLIDPEMAENVKLCSAPLVEGAIAAAISASSGASLQEVILEAENAISAKQLQLGINIVTPALENARPSSAALQFDWTVANPHGIHARPAAKLVELASRFHAKLWVENQQRFADLKSHNQIIQLQIRAHQPIIFYAEGEDAAQALAALKQLAAEHFGETLTENSTVLQGQGICQSRGQALFLPQSVNFAPNLPGCDDPKAKLAQAINQSKQQLADLATIDGLPNEFRDLFAAHQLLLDDIQTEISSYLAEKSLTEAVEQIFNELKQQYLALDDPYLQARALDIDDLRQRLWHNLLGVSQSLPSKTNRILCAEELFVSTLAQLLKTEPIGICLAKGSAYSHTTLLAKAANIPLIIQLGGQLAQIPPNSQLNLDWQTGQVQL